MSLAEQEYETRVTPEKKLIDAHVVILVNYLRPHHVEVYKVIASRVRQLTILLSTAMEADRKWKPDWGDLNVVVQKNWTWSTTFRSRTGYKAPNFVHFPIDTLFKLRSLKPDVVFSYEYGVRTLLAGLWRAMARNSRLVVVGNMSRHVEAERGFARKSFRSIIRRLADRFTYNGPSCQSYLLNSGWAAERLDHFPYAFDSGKAFHGQKEPSRDGWKRVLYSGFVEHRKGITCLASTISGWQKTNPETGLELIICGSGDQTQMLKELEGPRVRVRLCGHVGENELREAYATADFCVFPSLADEWGLVPVEAMASGVPVLGSVLAQSCETLILEDVNGWLFNPLNEEEFLAAFSRAMATDPKTLATMGAQARKDVEYISAEWAADHFIESLQKCLAGQTANGKRESRGSRTQ